MCIYHANCCDGMGAAWIVRKALGNDVDFIPATYQEEPPEVAGKDVIIVDFSYKRDVMADMAEEATSITVIDHHKTAEAELSPLLAIGVVDGIFDMEKSGAMLAWEWFFPHTEPPTLIHHIQDRDLWRFELEGTKEIQASLYSYPMEFDVWDQLMKMDLAELRKEGEAINRAHMKNINGLVEYLVQRQIIAGYEVPVLNCNYMFASDAGNIMANGEPFSATYYDTQENRKYSLRSSKDGGIDVSAIAAKFGGGGHKNAAGFKLPLSDLHLLNEAN